MKLLTIDDVTGLNEGDEVSGLQATIKQSWPVGPRQQGKSAKGKWKVQPAILKDATGEIRASFWNLFDDDLQDYVGKSVTVSGGVFAEDYQGKDGSVRQLKVSEEANVEFGVEVAAADPEVTRTMGGSSDDPKPDRKVVDVTPKPRPIDEKGASIERQVALKAAVELSSAGDVPEEVVGKAEIFYKFLSNGQG